MNSKNILLAAWITMLITSLPAFGSFAATPTVHHEQDDFKTSLLESYLQRCVEVLHSKGYNSDAIKTECTCELDYIDQHFDVFEQMLAGSETGNPQQINNFKKQLLQCKVKAEADL